MTQTATAPRIRWFVYAGIGYDRERIRHTATMRGQWDYDATCTCGWDSKTGGCVRGHIKDLVWMHKTFDCPLVTR